jgi:hypothetical protein
MMICEQKTKFQAHQLQGKQLEKHLKENTNFTDFIHSLIQREVMQDAVTVQQMMSKINHLEQNQNSFEVVKRYQKTDPALLLELPKSATTLIKLHAH